jgi:hypothetical protein
MIRVNCVTDKGGAVVLNDDHHVWASYAVATAGDLPPPEILHVGVTLDDGRRVQFFLNRKTRLIVVDIIDADENGGVEILRHTLKPIRKEKSRES